MKTEVFCSFEVEGIHNWPDCPHEEVDYLRESHRHMFGVVAYKIVEHGDRDIEFIMLKHEIEDYLYDKYATLNKRTCYFGSKSCEMLAVELIEKFDLSRCVVDEDGENGAIVTR